VLYFTSGKFGIACFALSGVLLSKFVSEFISFMARVCLNPGVFYVPVFFLQCAAFYPNCFYKIVSVFYVVRESRVILLSVCISIVFRIFLFICISLFPVML